MVCIRVGIPKGGVGALRLYYALRSCCNNKSTDNGVCRECEWDRRRAKTKYAIFRADQLLHSGEQGVERRIEKPRNKIRKIPNQIWWWWHVAGLHTAWGKYCRWKICVEKRNYVNATRITQLFVSTFSEENDDTHVWKRFNLKGNKTRTKLKLRMWFCLRIREENTLGSSLASIPGSLMQTPWTSDLAMGRTHWLPA